MTQAADTAPPPPLPDALRQVILGLLAPVLMTSAAATEARAAARQTIAAYQPTTANELITIAQLVGFALASLDSLRLSMPADLPLTMKLRLRGNANALERASRRAAATLAHGRAPLAEARGEHPRRTPAAPPCPSPDEAPHQAGALANRAGASIQPHQAQTSPPAEPSATAHNQRQNSLSWARAMTAVAAEYATELTQLPPAGRQDHLMRIDALSETARVLRNRDSPLRARLLASTALRG